MILWTCPYCKEDNAFEEEPKQREIMECWKCGDEATRKLWKRVKE